MEEEFLEEGQKQLPNLDLTQLVFRCEISPHAPEAAELRAQIMAAIEEDKMAPYYDHLCTKYGWVRDEELYTRLL
jgi:26S proteasome regulatory subunit N7